MKDDENIETMFSRFHFLVTKLQVLKKSYHTSDYVKNILRSLPSKYRPKVTSIQEAKKLSLESLVSNLQSREMELNRDEPVKQFKTLALKSFGRSEKSSQTKVHKEATNDEAFDEEFDDYEMDFIIKRFQNLAKKNNIFSGRSVKENCELDDEEEADKSKEEANLVLFASTFSDLESEVGSDSDSEDTKEVLSKLSKSDLITLCQDLMAKWQQKARHMKIIKMKHGLIIDELNLSKDKIGKLERDQISLIKYISNKPLDNYESTLQEFVISDFNITKLASMVYGVSKSKGHGIGFHQQPYNTRTKIFVQPSDPSSSSTAQKGLNAYFMPAVENCKVLNKSEPVMDNSQVLKKSESQTQRSRVPSKLEPKTLNSEVLKNSELKVIESKVP
ncbi:uncharacterized protein LOC127131326 [Lathyrus oleraceus]|uniref:uncharacterized protein LOC127131326 n=1 Tax=Pisum sativum TaxID=3888 RepID=UPI0021D3E3F1|nr:uncharacterized protein LOC127131326 [Pisum sativum]